MHIARTSQKRTIQDAAREQGFEIETVATKDSQKYSVNPVQFVLTRRLAQNVRREVRDGLKKFHTLNST